LPTVSTASAPTVSRTTLISKRSRTHSMRLWGDYTTGSSSCRQRGVLIVVAQTSRDSRIRVR
jgi:hypothetical protein